MMKPFFPGLMIWALVLACADAPAQHHHDHEPAAPTKPQRAKVEAGVVSMDVWADSGRLHILTARRAPGRPPQLEYQRSDDQGRTWSDPARVGDGQPAPEPAHRGMDVQIAASGERIVAVWTTHSDSSRFGRGPLAAAFSDDGGKTWKPSPNPADDGADTDHAFIDIAADANGTFHLVWLDAREGAKGLIYATSSTGGATWSPNRVLQSNTCECCWNTILCAPRGQAWVLYRQKTPRDMGIIRSADAGMTWSAPTSVGAFGWEIEACPHVGGGLAINPDPALPMLYATTWTAKAGRAGAHVLTSLDEGKTWSEPRRLGGASSWHSDIAALPGGVVAAVWDAYLEDGTAIYAAISKNAGVTWSAPRLLSDRGVSASHPRILAASDGFKVFWTQTPEGAPPTWLMRPLD